MAEIIDKFSETNWAKDLPQSEKDYIDLLKTYRPSFVYSLYHIPSKKEYIGSKISKTFLPLDTLFETYFSSSNVVKSLFEDGHPILEDWIVEIIEQFDTYEEAVYRENEILQNIPKDERDLYLNMNFSAGGSIIKGRSHFKYRDIVTGKLVHFPKDIIPPENYVRHFTMPPNRKGHRKWYCKHTSATGHSAIEDFPPGAILYSEYIKQKRAPKNKPGIHSAGTIWINNGINCKRIKPDLKIPEGWVIGKIRKVGKRKLEPESSGGTSGKVICNNYVENRYFRPEEIPVGWRKGSK